MKNLTPELIEKAKNAKSAEELLELAKANNVEITEEEARAYFDQLNSNGSVSDEELDAVAGGASVGGVPLTPAFKLEKGDRIMLKNWKQCSCGSKIGVCVAPGSSVLHATIRCESCCRIMHSSILTGTVVKI